MENSRLLEQFYGIRHEKRDLSGHLEGFCKELRQRAASKWDTLMVISGEPGVGKSSLGMQIARGVDPKWPVEHTAYSAEDALRLFRELGPGDSLLYDESVLGLLGQGGGRDEELRALVQALSIVRLKRITTICCVPDMRLLDSFVKYGRARYWVHVYKRGEGELHRSWRRARHRVSVSLLPYDEYRELSPLGFKNLDRTKLWKEYEANKFRRVDGWLEAHSVDPSGKVIRCRGCGKVGSRYLIQTHVCPASAAEAPNVKQLSDNGYGPVRASEATVSVCPECGRAGLSAWNLKVHMGSAHGPAATARSPSTAPARRRGKEEEVGLLDPDSPTGERSS